MKTIIQDVLDRSENPLEAAVQIALAFMVICVAVGAGLYGFGFAIICLVREVTG